MKFYAKKITAINKLAKTQILCNQNIKQYFILDDYQEFFNLIKSTTDPCFYEFIPENQPINLFFDIEIYKDKNEQEFNNSHEIVQDIKKTIQETFSSFQLKFIILESHSLIKKSYHIIVKSVQENTHFYFPNVKSVKEIIKTLFVDLVNLKIIDTSVYREGLFRTIYSSKFQEKRFLVKSNISDPFEPLDTFVCFTETPMKIIDETIEELDQELELDLIEPLQRDLLEKDKKIIKKFIKKHYNYSNDIREIKVDHKLNCIIVAINDRFCHNVDKEHLSNNQYIIIDINSSRQKCHDTDCSLFKYNEIKMVMFPKEINEIIKNVLKINKQELELVDKAIKECKDYITENFDDNIQEIEFDKNEMVFRGNVSNDSVVRMNGKCRECKIEHQITNIGYCLKCIVCKSIFPKNQLIPVDERYKHLNNFWNSYNQIVNNGTLNININNYYNNNNSELEFSCDVQLDSSIFKNKELTKLFNQVLDGHKVIKIGELISQIEIDFKYTNGEWYYFNENIWKLDKESLEFRKKIVNLSNQFNRIKSFYENKKSIENNGILIKNVKSLVNKLYKPGFEDDIIKGSKMYYNDETFIKKLNSKKHLLPFTNGVFDLVTNKFRKTEKDDYINLTVGFDYNSDPSKDNQEVYTFLNQVLPKKDVRDYVLKKMSECLNGDIPNTYFLMFIGDTGANGKSQLLNLMKAAMGEFGEKVEVTLLTRKRNNANETNTEKMKLMNKRFAFLSEPEDGEKINISLLKELTGSEEIVARGLYQDSLSFVMEAKLFLACNELPEIKGEDTALWRRIRVIDFPSRFIDDPKEPGEYKIDRTLPSRMREDLSWRQTFMRILLSYYNQDIKEPEEVKMKTNEYRQENNEFYNWCNENIEYSENSFLELKTLCEIKNIKVKKEKTKLKNQVILFLKQRIPNICSECKISSGNKYGWNGLVIKE